MYSYQFIEVLVGSLAFSMFYVTYKYDCISTVFLRQANKLTYFVRQHTFW